MKKLTKNSSVPEQKITDKSDDNQEILAANLAKAMLKVKTKSDIEALKEWSNPEQWQAAQQLLTLEERQTFVEVWNNK